MVLAQAAGCLGQALALLMGGERVVLLEIAERRLRSAERMRRGGRTFTTGVDAGLRLLLLGAHWPSPQPGVVRPRLGP